MIVVLKHSPNPDQLNGLVSWLEDKGIEVHTSLGDSNMILGLVGDTAKLDVDLIIVSGDGTEIKKPTENFFTKALHEIKSCIASYTVDYNALGNVYDDEEDVLDDLRMMAKQGASLEEMREVLENCLCVLPTPAMLGALYQVHMQTVRWIGMAPAVLN